MLDELEPDQFEELLTATRVGLDYEGWLQMAYLASAICNKLELLVAAALQVSPKFLAPQDFLPPNYHELMGGTHKSTEEIVDEMGERMRQMYG